MPRFHPVDGEILRDLVRSREAVLSKRAVAESAGAIRARLHAIDLELLEADEAIRNHCFVAGLPLPRGVLELEVARRRFLEISSNILASYLRLLALRRDQRDLALERGNLARAASAQEAIRALHETIRKHCESAQFPLPAELDEESH